MDAPSRALFDRKAQALGMARATAEAEGRAPNLTDYWRAALTMPELEGNARMISDLSGQTLDGFTVKAAPRGTQVGDACASFLYNQLGEQMVSNDASLSAVKCWQ